MTLLGAGAILLLFAQAGGWAPNTAIRSRGPGLPATVTTITFVHQEPNGPAYREVARIELDKGTITFGDGMPQDQAIRETWEMFAAAVPEILPKLADDACWRKLLGR